MGGPGFVRATGGPRFVAATDGKDGTKPVPPDEYDPAALERETARLMADDDVQRESGIYEYLLSGGERESALNIRKFTDSQKRAAYERQGGKCGMCGKSFAYEEMHGDHKTPWSKGGHTMPDNLQMLCRTCNLKKGKEASNNGLAEANTRGEGPYTRKESNHDRQQTIRDVLQRQPAQGMEHAQNAGGGQSRRRRGGCDN